MMKRRLLLCLTAFLSAQCGSSTAPPAKVTSTEIKPAPVATAGLVKVAFVVTEKFNLLDVAGVWEVFGGAKRPIPGKTWEQGERLFQVYMVSDTTQPIHAGGGAIVTAPYTFDDAPQPDIVVVGAQTGNPPVLYDYLRKQHERGTTIMSVCVGAIKLARLGFLDGKPATTHHDYIEGYAEGFPNVKWQRGRRYVRVSDTVFTSGGDGLSGIDLALHLVDLRFGRDIAQGTADYLEHHGDEWKQDDTVPGVAP